MIDRCEDLKRATTMTVRHPISNSTTRSRVFVATSSESLEYAYAVQENLERDADVTVWPQDIFHPSISALESLLKAIERFDFGVFVFSADDLVRIRGKRFGSVRDNVLFELGLFIGKLGRERNFVLIPGSNKDFHIATDLIGMMPLAFDDLRADQNLRAALGPACNQIRKAIADTGLRTSTPEEVLRQLAASSQLYFHVTNQRTGKCLDVTDWSSADGAPVQQWLYHAGNNQLWALRRVDDAHYQFECKHTGKCLTASDDGRPAVVQQPFRHRNTQKWRLVSANGRSYRIVNKATGLCLDVHKAKPDDGVRIVQNPPSGAENQMWWLNVHIDYL